MTVTAQSSLIDVAFEVGGALRRHGISAVLTGGACVALHTDGTYASRDLDFVLQRLTSVTQLDTALGELGFRRDGNQYRHPDIPWYVEFPPGPLAIGGDCSLHPTRLTRGDLSVVALSPTESCMDRLAAFYHWRDRQSLALAVRVARHRVVDFRRISAWSKAEGQSQSHREFLAEIQTGRSRPTRRRKPAR